MTSAPIPPAPTPSTRSTPAADVLAEARAGQRAELAALAQATTRLLVLGPGIVLWLLFAAQAVVRQRWQLAALFATSFGMWCCWWWARRLAARGEVESTGIVLFGSIWVHDTAALCLRSGGFGAVALAAMGSILLVWLLAPAFLVPACALVAAQLVGTRLLDLAGVLPYAETPRAAAAAMEIAMALLLVPLIGVVLRRGTRAHELPFRRLEESAGSHLELLETVERVQPELRALAARVNESASGVSSSATQLSATAQELSRVTVELEALLTHSAAAAAQARSVADATRRSSAESGEALGAVEAELERFMAAMAELAGNVATLSERSAGTEQVISAVEDVHEHVKVLAVNAALEAARAGEAGRGMQFVATEMRAMITGTEASVRQGRSLLSAVRGEATATVRRAESATRDLRQHVAALRRSRELIGGIIASFGETAGAIDTIAAAGEDQKRQIEHVSRAMAEMRRSADGLSRAASELLDGAERVSRAQAELGALFDGERAPAA